MTNVEAGMVAVVHYTGTFPASGEEFDSSRGSEPLAFLVGTGNMIPGFEQELLGAGTGDEREFTLMPADAYGTRDEDQVVRIDKNEFDGMDLSVGLQLIAEIEGQPSMFRVVEIAEEHVIADFNHPLAGEALHFEVEVVEVRKATPEELDHGHVHGPGGHQH